MVVDQFDNATADRLFHALSDATRRDILRQAGAVGDQSVSALARRYPMSVAAVQKHVNVLERAGLVEKVRRGREQIVQVRPERLRSVHVLLDQLEQMWVARLERFADVLDDESNGGGE